jgi:SHS2 domain-containing protein
MRKDGFQITENPNHFSVDLWASNLAGIFQQSGKSLFSIITKLDRIKAKNWIDITIDAPRLEDLLRDWLNQLIEFKNSKNMVFSEFEIKRVSHTRIHARAGGEEIIPDWHTIGQNVSSAIDKKLLVDQNDGYRARVILQR